MKLYYDLVNSLFSFASLIYKIASALERRDYSQAFSRLQWVSL